MLIWDRFLTKSPLPAGPYLAEFLRQGSLFGNENCLSAFPDRKQHGLRRIWYTGAGMGYMAHFVRFPDQRFSIVAFGNHSTNAGWYAMERVLPQIAELYLAEEFPVAVPQVPPSEPAWSEQTQPVDLTDKQVSELQSMTGPYRLPWGDYAEVVLRDTTLCVRRIYEPWTKGRLEELVSVGPNRFRSDRGYLEYELSFESPDNGPVERQSEVRPVVAIRYMDGEEQRWTPVEFAAPGHDSLQEYCGEYYCDDLESVYRLSTTDGKLFVQFNYGRKRAYRPTIGEQFVPAGERFVVPITFHRGEDGEVTHFVAEFDRSGELEFVKQPPARAAQPAEGEGRG